MVTAQLIAEIPTNTAIQTLHYQGLASLRGEDVDIPCDAHSNCSIANLLNGRGCVCGIERTQCEESAKLTDVNDSIDRSTESPNAFDAPQTVWTTAATLRPGITGRSTN